jgi:ABC-type transport system involved in multi-copper enzyme maturation permease subunit
MPQTLSREAAPQLLHYRPWRGQLRSTSATIWPIARVALNMMIRRRLFWVLYVLGLLFFLLFFFGQYLLAYAESLSSGPNGGVGGLIKILRNLLDLDGSGKSYRTFFDLQGYTVMVILALAGATVIGNDLRFGSLPFYLSKPLARWHYLAGKLLAVAVFVNLLTTLPALILWVQYGVLKGWDYFIDHWELAVGIVAYGAILSVTLSLILLATAVWLRKTVPLIMVWSTLFIFLRIVPDVLVMGLDFDRHWRLFNLWNDNFLVGSVCLGVEAPNRLQHPDWYSAALVLGGVSLTCLTYLILRIRAVEVIR